MGHGLLLNAHLVAPPDLLPDDEGKYHWVTLYQLLRHFRLAIGVSVVKCIEC